MMRARAILVAVAWCISSGMTSPAETAVRLRAFGGISPETAADAAVAASPAVARARAALEAALADRSGSVAQGLPAPSFSFSQAPQAGGAGTVLQKISTAGMRVSLSDLLARGDALASSDARVAAAVAGVRSAIHDERLRAAELYDAAVRAAAEVGLRERLLAAAQADERAAERRFRAGDAPELDVLRSRSALARARADLSAAQTAAATALAALAAETRIPEQQFGRVTVRRTIPLADVAATADRLERSADRNIDGLPDVRQAEDLLAAARASLRAARWSAFPSVDADLGYAYGVDTAVNVRGPAASLSIVVPLPPTSRAATMRARAAVNDAAAQVRDVRRNDALAIRDAVVRLRSALAALQSARAELVAAERERAAVELGYRAGALSGLDLIDAERTETAARIGELAAESDAVAAYDAVRLWEESLCRC